MNVVNVEHGEQRCFDDVRLDEDLHDGRLRLSNEMNGGVFDKSKSLHEIKFLPLVFSELLSQLLSMVRASPK